MLYAMRSQALESTAEEIACRAAMKEFAVKGMLFVPMV
jgi:hypothetical protein